MPVRRRTLPVMVTTGGMCACSVIVMRKLATVHLPKYEASAIGKQIRFLVVDSARLEHLLFMTATLITGHWPTLLDQQKCVGLIKLRPLSICLASSVPLGAICE